MDHKNEPFSITMDHLRADNSVSVRVRLTLELGTVKG